MKAAAKTKLTVTSIALSAIAALTHQYWSVDEYTVTVSNTETKQDLNLVYTLDGVTFKVEDTWAYLRFNSSDVYGAIENGVQYRIRASGHRVGLFSMYPNIVSIEEIGVDSESESK